MAEKPELKKGEEEHSRFVRSLKPEERLLIMLRDELYGGKWDNLKQDLKDRLEGRPYVFKLAGRIKDDLARIEKLEGYEKKHNIDLSDYTGGEKREQQGGKRIRKEK
ncbi:MAG: hypothetical protein N2234_05165 [Planctomycetota bacterium]|nr:hypothetical protein [Planctomycetota bacterium]